MFEKTSDIYLDNYAAKHLSCSFPKCVSYILVMMSQLSEAINGASDTISGK